MLERAQAQADAGLLREAADTLQELVSRDALRADAWALLGATRLGLGSEPEAEECFRRVVYLRPDDALALLQLSALAEARGDDATAHRLRARAARCDRRDEG